uniref:Uncharacterized protein n=1 Tax=Haptolina brevifila TaxID=156173 RepID=A0A7S2D8Q0_9EUKA|mmetsp:Transcript_34746/g.69215  ORF Transcript_34746/g.69215 Transcript_34746/m.69215 type:complete len:110 (+) Transcript_34746:859-1188(+)
MCQGKTGVSASATSGGILGGNLPATRAINLRLASEALKCPARAALPAATLRAVLTGGGAPIAVRVVVMPTRSRKPFQMADAEGDNLGVAAACSSADASDLAGRMRSRPR